MNEKTQEAFNIITIYTGELKITRQEHERIVAAINYLKTQFEPKTDSPKASTK